MKNLFYKEMKLAMHPVVWVFLFVFPLMVLIPSYPGFIGFIYICSAYPILFLGANKGQQSNDIYFSCLLPIKKSDVIKARMMTVIFLQVVTVILTCALAPVGQIFKDAMLSDPSLTPEQAEELMDIGFGIKGLFASAGFTIVSFAVYDLIFFSMFYRNGRSIVGPTLIGMLVFMTIETIFVVVLPLSIPAYKDFFEGNILISLAALTVGILISAGLHFFSFKIADKLFSKVDL